MNISDKIILTYIIVINVMAYMLMAFDKYRAKYGGQRISEKTLFFIAFILGAAAICLGMKAPLYHKASKTGFKISIPLLLVLNISTVVCLFKFCK